MCLPTPAPPPMRPPTRPPNLVEITPDEVERITPTPRPWDDMIIPPRPPNIMPGYAWASSCPKCGLDLTKVLSVVCIDLK